MAIVRASNFKQSINKASNWLFVFNVQAMLLRTELLAAQKEIKAIQEDTAARAQDLIRLEEKLSKAQQQLSVSRQEEAELRVAMGGMVERRILESLQLQLQEVGRMVPVSELHASQAEAGKLQEDIRWLNQRLQMAQSETEDLKTSIQVHFLQTLGLLCTIILI